MLVLDTDISDIIENEINKATEPSDLIKWLIACKYALMKMNDLDFSEDWSKEIIKELLGEIAKLILSVRDKL